MRNPVDRVEIDLRDPYEDARRSLTRPGRGRAVGWLLTMTSLLAGCAIGWQVAGRPDLLALASKPAGASASPAWLLPDGMDPARIEPGNPLGEVGRSGPPPYADPRPEAAGPFAPAQAPASLAPAANTWPIVLHRAGDGRFYADLLLDGRVVTARIDPTAAQSHIAGRDLPATVGGGYWQAQTVALEHLRLPAERFAIDGTATAETVIGRDLLDRFFTLEEGRDRLGLHRQGGR